MPTRLLNWLAVPLLIFVFAGLGLYHYGRLDRQQQNDEKLKELAQQTLDEERPARTDWPHWRGPYRDGVSTETDLLTVWPTDGPKQLWEKPTGEGYSSVAVAGGRVFTIFQDGADETVVCWNAETGAEHWRFSYAAQYKNKYGNGPRSTPTIDGEFVYTVGATGVMHCLTAFEDQPVKRVIWTKDLPRDFNAETPTWGFASSPLVEDGRVFYQPGGKNGSSLAAFDKNTGEVLWKQHDDVVSFSSPMPATFAGQRQILFFTGDRLVSVVPETGAQLWEHLWPIERQCNIATPIVVKDYVFISSGYGRGCAMLKIDKTGAAWKPTVVYKNEFMRNQFSTSVRYKNLLFGFDDTNLQCMDILTGKKLWKQRGFKLGSVIVVGDHLIIHGDTGVIALAEATGVEYREKSRFQFSKQNNACWSVPVVADGRLYVRDQTRLVCFDVKAGK